MSVLQEDAPDKVSDKPSVERTPEFPFGPRMELLPKQLQKAIADIFQTLQKREQYDRRVEMLRDRMHRFYDDGVQYFYADWNNGTFQVGSPGQVVNIGSNSFQCPDYIGAYNIFYPFRRSLDAVLTQNPPGISFEPDNPSRSEDMEAAETAEGYRHYFDQENKDQQMQQEIARYYSLSGRVVSRTFYDKNSAYGVNDKGEARTIETARFYGTLESKVSVYAKLERGPRPLKNLTYTFLYEDPDFLEMKRDYPEIADEIQGGEAGLGENEWERCLRLGVAQAQKGYFLKTGAGSHLITKIHGYIRPCTWVDKDEIYSPSEDEDESDGETVAEKLDELFPEGLHAVFVGKSFAEAESVSIDDAIAISFPKVRDGMTGGAMMEFMVVIQDEFNDLKNAERSAYEKGWPSLWVSADDAEYDAIMDQKAEPFAIRQLKQRAPGTSAEDSFYREPDMELPESFVECLENLQSTLPQFITGAVPALQGNAKASQTASGQAMDRAQALGQLGPAWANEQDHFAMIYYQAALLAADNPDHAEGISIIGDNGTTFSVNLQKLKKGNFNAHPSKDSNFPESTAAKRENLNQTVTVLATNPQMAQIFWQDPRNFEAVQRLQGNTELEWIPAEAWKKQTREIDELLKSAPVPDQAAYQAALVQHATMAIVAQGLGHPVPSAPTQNMFLKSSVPVDKDDYHEWESPSCKAWLSTNACWRELNFGQNAASDTPGNLLGVQNVRLHKAEHDVFIAQAQAQAMAMQQQAQPQHVTPPRPTDHGGKAVAPEAHGSVQKGAAPPGAPGTQTI